MFVEVRTQNLPLTSGLEGHARERFSRGLLNFASRIAKVVVRIVDINGPRGGIDKLCRATVFLEKGGGTLVAEARGESVEQTVAAAVARTRARVGRQLQKSSRPWQQAA